MTDLSKLDLPRLNLPEPNLSIPVPTMADYSRTLADISRSLTPPNMAEYAVKAIYEEIADFEASLDADHEVGMPIVGGPAGLCVHVREVYRFGTDKLVFVGIDSDQRPVRLIQHLTQLNLLMLAAPKLGPVAVRIGFHAAAAEGLSS
jgi:hypothetical protein